MDMQSRAAGDAPRAAIYCRLSEEDADKADPGQDSRSIQNQKSMLVRYAVEQGWQIYNIYSDDDYTGSDRERPQFNRLCKYYLRLRHAYALHSLTSRHRNHKCLRVCISHILTGANHYSPRNKLDILTCVQHACKVIKCRIRV